MELLAKIISENADWLVERIYSYAVGHGYNNFSSAPVASRKASVERLSEVITDAIKNHPEPKWFEADNDFTQDGIVAFGTLEANKHRTRGANVGPFLGLLKYYRQSYLDLIQKSDIDDAKKESYCFFIKRFFDHMEIGLCVEWINAAEKTLQEHSEWLKVTLDSIGDAVIATNLKGEVVFMNPVAQELTGYSEEESIGQPIARILNIINEENREPAEIPVQKVINDGSIVGLANHTALISREGNEYSIADSAAPIKNLNGEIIGVVMVFQNVTERKIYERQLIASEERYRRLVDFSPNPIVVYNKQGIIEYANIQAAQLVGAASPEELLGRLGFDFIHPDCKEAVKERTIQSMQGKELPAMEEKFVGLDGRVIDVEVAAIPITYQDKTSVQLVLRDITDHKKAQEKLLESEERYRKLVEHSPEPMMVDIKGVIAYVNQAAMDIYGAEKPEQIIGKQVIELIHPDSKEEFLYRVKALQEEGDLPMGKLKLTRLDGRIIYTEDVAIPITYDGQPAVQVVFRDVTHRVKAEEVLKQQAAAMEASMDGVAILNDKGVYVYMNEAHAQIYGYRPQDLVGHTWHKIVTEEYKEKYQKQILPLLFEKGNWRGESVGQKRDGSTYPQEVSLSLIDGGGMVCVVRDVTERKEAEEAVRHQAYHDPLTDLPNRMLFNDRLNMALAHAQRSNSMLAVIFLDLDNFKNINDLLGHAMGDQFLLGVTERFSGCLREEDTVSRLGGDEFTILLPEISQVDDAVHVAKKIIETLKKPWVIAGHEYFITASIGIAVYPNDGPDAETLMKHADMAMYRAKEKGNIYQLYTPTMNAMAYERIAMEGALRRALEREEFILYYQPQVETTTGEIIGMEALLRWRDPKKGLISPLDFIPLAEETGLIVPIGEWVLRSACQYNKNLQDQGFQPIRVSVNLSALQFQKRNLVDTVAKILQETDLNPHWLVLEITESVAMKDVDFTINTLTELRRMGIQIAIDDFGTGYSSLNYLKRFPIHTLKIDQSFVRDITNNSEDAAIVTTVIFLAQNLNLRVIAEGVETEEQLAFLKERRCGEIQGYLFSKPVPSDEFKDLLARKVL